MPRMPKMHNYFCRYDGFLLYEETINETVPFIESRTMEKEESVLLPETGTRVLKAQTAGAESPNRGCAGPTTTLSREANVTTPSLSSLQADSSPALGGFPKFGSLRQVKLRAG